MKMVKHEKVDPVSISSIINKLQNIEGGESYIYHSGKTLPPLAIREMIAELIKQNRIIAVQQFQCRMPDDPVYGTTYFNYVAIGKRQPLQ